MMPPILKLEPNILLGQAVKWVLDARAIFIFLMNQHKVGVTPLPCPQEKNDSMPVQLPSMAKDILLEGLIALEITKTIFGPMTL